MMTKYRVVVLTSGENVFAGNRLTFDTYEEAQAYGNDLWSRWTRVQSFAVIPCTVQPDNGSYWTKELVEKNSK